ncbi:MAG TPA: DUF4010 domain-containing protein, partial [Gemmatimonadales bacterium]|nr:DUF4010 domain-containing protein [Gemmatimonadales bacterium]
FIVAAYVAAARRPEQRLDGTTEIAALVVLGLSTYAGLGQFALAGGLVAIVVLTLREKALIHSWVRKIDQVEMRAGVPFLVLAAVVLPLLPAGPYEGLWGFRPRALGTVVLALSGVNFAGYLARQAIGASRGYGLTGLIGGVVSSTVVTLQFSRHSRTEPRYARDLALGELAASTVLFVRVVLLSAALDREVARALLALLAAPLLVGAAMIGFIFTRTPPRGETEAGPPNGIESPLGLKSAIRMAVLFQFSMIGLGYLNELWGTRGLFGSAVVLGLTDVDALTVSMSRLAAGATGAELAARGIAVGILSNTVFKMGLAGVIGTEGYRRRVLAGLALLGVVLGATLLVS